ncbi:MAG: 4-hydroxythreonine-4-phosphate dehydrogenase PdxA [Alphaproteobacteria bacterium]|nr:4-hydroxythreonine-4-phosphate dehydrogenase PdxA [Alphaproteobacteria bacterium]MBF0249131.1 4-hydroxythreonine-4-phosphate dehydrogenase PdxA [Alphaproteobacteria bacterium]
MTQPLALTMGDPAGVGPDITLKAWIRRGDGVPAFFTIADAGSLAAAVERLGLDVPIHPIDRPAQAGAVFDAALPVLHLPLHTPAVPGRPSSDNAPAVVESIRRAVDLTQDGEAAAVVTNPIAKEVMYGAGFAFPGHTEYLAHLGGDVKPVMMLACDRLRVVLATVHVSLRDAVDQLNADTICDVARITHAALKRDFGLEDPVIAVAGLNPHAGEGGSMGREEIDIIQPAIDRLAAEGVRTLGPLPPDTMFTAKALPTYDAALCMYHDQGLIPLKTLDFERGVNTTLGLPFVRTSPDHGTAFDIAGIGRASEESLMAAMRMAAAMARARAGS